MKQLVFIEFYAKVRNFYIAFIYQKEQNKGNWKSFYGFVYTAYWQ